MPCNQKQIDRFPWTIERAAALFREARTEYTDKGITDFNQVVDGLSARHNLAREIVIKGLSEPKGVSRTLTNDMWVKQNAARRLANTAEAAMKEMHKSNTAKNLIRAVEAPRRLLLTGHFGAFTKSHLSDQLFYNPQTYKQNFLNSWALAKKSGIAAHEARVRAEFNPHDPVVQAALRGGLNVGEGGVGRFAKETAEMTGGKKIFSSKNLPEWFQHDRAAMAYDELRVSRMKIFRKEYDRLSPEERANTDFGREQVRDLAAVLNHDTGTTATGYRIARFLFLSPRLFPAQLKHTYYDIPRALFNVGRASVRERGVRAGYAASAPAMRYVARKTAILASAYTGIMAANYGIGKALGLTGNKELERQFTPNFGQEGIGRGSFLRPKVFGRSIPISPTIELLKLPVQMIMAGAAAGPGESKTMTALSRGVRTVLTRQNPLAAIAEEVLFGQDVGSGRPIPKSILGIPASIIETPETKTKKRMATGEWLGKRIPIPAQNYIQEFYDEATNHGMTPRDAAGWARFLLSAEGAKALIAPTIELGTSYHLSEDREQPPPPGRRTTAQKLYYGK